MRQSTLRFEAQDVAVRTWHPPDAHENPNEILCFPFSGGGSTAFRPLAEALGPAWRVHGVNPPGHGLGAAAPCRTAVADLVHDYLTCLPDDLIEGSIVLGYSVGGYIAHHLVCALLSDPRRPRPRGLVMCAVPPYARRSETYSDRTDDELFDGLRLLGGIPEGLGDARGAFGMFAHVVRADFMAYERCPAPAERLALPTLIVAGDTDPIYRREWFPEWGRFFERPSAATVEGTHIFLPDNSAGLAGALEAWVGALPPTSGPANGPPHAT